MLKDKNTALILFTAVFTAVWTAFEFLYTTVITHGSYSFRLGNLAEPLILGILLGYFLVYRRVGDITDTGCPPPLRRRVPFSTISGG